MGAGALVADQAGVLVGRSEAVENQGEAEGEKGGPEEQKKDERDRAVGTVELLPRFVAFEAFAEKDPRLPGEDEEEAGDAEAAGRATGNDDGLYGVCGDQTATEQTMKSKKPMHER